MSSESIFDEMDRMREVRILTAPVPVPPHPAVQDVLNRQIQIPGHIQEKLSSAHVVQVGVGGLGDWSKTGLLKSGVTNLTIVDDDLLDWPNPHRTGHSLDQVGEFKVHASGANGMREATKGAKITCVPFRFEEAVDLYPHLFDGVQAFKVDVDSEHTRFDVASHARKSRVPCVITGIDPEGGFQSYVFLQGPQPQDACLLCALPNMDFEMETPCAAVIIPSCFVVAAYSLFLTFQCLMGWGDGLVPYNWRTGDLGNRLGEGIGWIERSPSCPAPEMHQGP